MFTVTARAQISAGRPEWNFEDVGSSMNDSGALTVRFVRGISSSVSW